MIHEDDVVMPNGRERRSEVHSLRTARRRAVDERRAEAIRLDKIQIDRRAAQLAERERLRTQERRERDRERNRLLVEKNAGIKAVRERANEAEVTNTAPVTTGKVKAQSATNMADASVEDGATILYGSAAPSSENASNRAIRGLSAVLSSRTVTTTTTAAYPRIPKSPAEWPRAAPAVGRSSARANTRPRPRSSAATSPDRSPAPGSVSEYKRVR